MLPSRHEAFLQADTDGTGGDGLNVALPSWMPGNADGARQVS